MKIEMAESLIRSWLRHCESCQIAELNWKPSPVWSKNITDEIETIFNITRDSYPDVVGNNNLAQLLKQSEVDVLGMRVNELGAVDLIYAFDCAFHSKGLAYGDHQRTQARIHKKLLRTALLLKAYFPKVNARIEFVAPFVNPGRIQYVENAVKAVRETFSESNYLKFDFIGPDRFSEVIFTPVAELEGSISDTSELFMRAWQLAAPLLNNKRDSDEVVQRVRAENNDMDSEKHRKLLISAFYLSKYGHSNLKCGNQTETIDAVAGALSVKRNTLKNNRDFYDSHTDAPRVGWKAALNSQQQSIMDEYDQLDEEALRRIVLGYIE